MHVIRKYHSLQHALIIYITSSDGYLDEEAGDDGYYDEEAGETILIAVVFITKTVLYKLLSVIKFVI